MLLLKWTLDFAVRFRLDDRLFVNTDNINLCSAKIGLIFHGLSYNEPRDVFRFAERRDGDDRVPNTRFQPTHECRLYSYVIWPVSEKENNEFTIKGFYVFFRCLSSCIFGCKTGRKLDECAQTSYTQVYRLNSSSSFRILLRFRFFFFFFFDPTCLSITIEVVISTISRRTSLNISSALPLLLIIFLQTVIARLCRSLYFRFDTISLGCVYFHRLTDLKP